MTSPRSISILYDRFLTSCIRLHSMVAKCSWISQEWSYIWDDKLHLKLVYSAVKIVKIWILKYINSFSKCCDLLLIWVTTFLMTYVLCLSDIITFVVWKNNLKEKMIFCNKLRPIWRIFTLGFFHVLFQIFYLKIIRFTLLPSSWKV